MICPSCKRNVQDGTEFCTFCGCDLRGVQAGATVATNQAQAAGQYNGANAAAAVGSSLLSKVEFCKQYATKNVRTNVTVSAVAGYVCAICTLLVNVLYLKNIYSIIDVLIIVGVSLGIHIKKSRICAAMLLAYSIVSVGISIMDKGTLSGWLIVVAGGYAVWSTFALQKQYDAYCAQQNPKIIWQ